MDRSRLQQFISTPLDELRLAEPLFLSPDQSIREAVERMSEESYSCVLAAEGDRLVGIFTERDVMTKCLGEDFDWEQPLGTAVTRDPRTIEHDRPVAEAIASMRQHRYRTLPVVEDGQVIGLIRLHDLLTHLAEAYPEEVLNIPPRPHQVMDKREGG